MKKSYKFALRSSLFITIFSSFLLFFTFFICKISFWITLPLAGILFIVSFLILQYRVENFMYKRIQNIYNEIPFFKSYAIDNQSITTDVATLSENINKFADTKKREIELLKDRENFRKEYIGNISHELKTPLFTVQGYILTLLDGAMEDKTLLEKYLSRASEGVERLVYVVKDLEMISKLETGELTLDYQDFNLIELVQRVFDMFEMKALKREISLTFDREYTQPIYVYADRERIQQVLANLIVNSIKYGKNNGTTEVSFEKMPNNCVLIKIADNGEGVIKEHLPRLFERFYRVDKSGNRSEGGSGLGLSIVKHIIEAHKQKVYAESIFGLGSEFSFTLQLFENQKVI